MVSNGPLTRYVKLRVAHALGTFSPPLGLAIPTCITARASHMSGTLTSGFLWRRWRGKRSRHSRRMRNPQFYVCVKRPMDCAVVMVVTLSMYWKIRHPTFQHVESDFLVLFCNVLTIQMWWPSHISNKTVLVATDHNRGDNDNVKRADSFLSGISSTILKRIVFIK